MHAKRIPLNGLTGKPKAPAPDPRSEILDYLRTHPSAADTLDGIVEWWLPRQRHETARKAIQGALDDLVGQGLLDELATEVGPRLYRLRRPAGDSR